MTGDGLVGVERVSGLDDGTIVADLATSVPTPTDDGRTYTFQPRPGLRYSNGVPVRAGDVLPSVGAGHSGGRQLGLLRRARRRRHVLEGTLRPRTRRGHRRRDRHRHDASPRAGPEFLYKLTIPAARPAPPSAPMKPTALLGVPGTGRTKS